jgi:hypothetical protein
MFLEVDEIYGRTEKRVKEKKRDRPEGLIRLFQ